MKKILCSLLVIVLCFSLTACNANDNDGSSSENETYIEYEEIITSSNGAQQSNQQNASALDNNANNQNLNSNVNSADNTNNATNNNLNSGVNNNTNNNTGNNTNAQVGNNTANNNANNTVSNNLTTNSSNDGTADNSKWIDFETTVEVDICDSIVRAYLDATDPRSQYTFLSEYGHLEMDYQVLPISWRMNGSEVYTIYISENADFSNSYVSKFSGSKFTGAMCIPGKTYYWKVVSGYSDEILGGGKMHITDAPVRWLNIEGLHNVRDMGGWKTESGKTIKYGKIYRGGKLEDIESKGIEKLKVLGIKSDIDIRSTASWDSNGAVPSTGLKYFFFDTNTHYDYVLSGGANESEIRENYPKLFEQLANESNYPIYLHCNYGNDRTGSMAFILNGLLGVTYEDLTRDFELTSYAYSHDNRWRGNGTGGTFGPNDLIQENISGSHVDARWGMMNKAFMESKYCTDGTLATAIENFLIDRGVNKAHINAYKQIMLG